MIPYHIGSLEPDLGQPVISQHSYNIFMLDHKPWMASIPQLYPRDRIGAAQLGVFGWWIPGLRAREGEGGRVCSGHLGEGGGESFEEFGSGWERVSMDEHGTLEAIDHKMVIRLGLYTSILQFTRRI